VNLSNKENNQKPGAESASRRRVVLTAPPCVGFSIGSMIKVEKICPKCKIKKPISDFYSYKYICKSCHYQESLEWHRNNKEKARFAVRKWRLKNLDVDKRNYKAWASKNKGKRREIDRKWYKKTWESKPIFRLLKLHRSRIGYILKRLNLRKRISSNSLIGCSPKELKTHIELQFLEGMTWENHGLYGWHVDHIKPLSSFDLTQTEQQKIAFHYTNLQPLWAKDNILKSNK